MDTWEVVKRIEETSQISAERTKAILLYNFGPEGKRARRVVWSSDPLDTMVIEVCNYYESLLSEDNDEHE